MYYYAYIDIETGFCHDVMEVEEHMDNPSYIELSGLSSYAEYYKTYPIRKTYENGIWRDTTVAEAESILSTTIGERVTLNGEWLNIILDNKASVNHTHTASAVGAIATGDVATVSEVETYLAV